MATLIPLAVVALAGPAIIAGPANATTAKGISVAMINEYVL